MRTHKYIISGFILLLFILNTQLLGAMSPKKVACIGNSITEGVGLPSSDSYPMVMQTLLDTTEYEVKNFGVSGRTLIKKGDWPYWNEAKYTQSLSWEPDIVIIKLGTNDVNPRGNWAHINDYVNDYIEFINSYKKLKSNPIIYVCYPAPAFTGNFMNINDQSVIVDQLIPKIDSVASITNSTVIDLHTPLLDKGRFFYDKIHPSFRGTAYMAHIVAQAICPSCVIDPIAEDFLVDIASQDYTDEAKSMVVSPGSDQNLLLINDNDPVTGVLLSGNSAELKFELANSLKVAAYSITTGKSDKKNFPKSWKVEGSKSGRLWYKIDERTNQTFDQLETQLYKLDNTSQDYLFFRITITENVGGESLSINEFQLFGSASNSEKDITGNGGIISGEYEGYPGELVDNIIDKNTQTKYCVVDKNGGWIQYESPEPVAVRKYVITSTKDLPERDLKSWSFLGSNDGVNWDILDIKVNQNFVGPLHSMGYAVQSVKKYSKFRLVITEIKRSTTFELSELQIFEAAESSINNDIDLIINNAYSKNGVLYIESSSDEFKDYYLYDSTGKLFGSGQIQKKIEIPYPYTTGVCFVSVVNQGKTSTIKVTL